MTRRMDDETRGFASRERASRAKRSNERTSSGVSRPRRSISRLTRSSRSLEEETRIHHGVGRPSFIRIRRGGVVLVVARANGARGGRTRAVKGTRAKGARGTAGMTARWRAKGARARRDSRHGRDRWTTPRGDERPSSRRSVREDDGDGRTATRGRARRTVGGAVKLKKFTEIFANLFPIWTILAAVAG